MTISTIASKSDNAGAPHALAPSVRKAEPGRIAISSQLCSRRLRVVCGIRDRAMPLVGFAGGLRRLEITELDVKRDQTVDGRGWIEIFDKSTLVTLGNRST